MSERREWPVLRRLVDLSQWALSMFEEKKDGKRRLSGTRVTVAWMAFVFADGVVFPLGWPDAFVAFAILFAIGIAKAIDRAPADTVVRSVTGMFGKPAQAGATFAERVIQADAPHEWAKGEADEGVL
jgi:hypothetical protein